MSSDLTSIQSILWHAERDDPLLSLHRLRNQSNSKPDGDGPKAPTRNRRGRNSDAVLSVARAMYNECAVDANALGFMAKMLVQTTLPHRAQPGKQYSRIDGDLTLSIVDLAGVGLPYGSYPRLLLIWITTEAVRTKSRTLELGGSLSSFMAQLGLSPTGGRWGTIPRLRDQMQRLFSAAISTRWANQTGDIVNCEGQNLIVAEEFDLWWSPQEITEAHGWKSTVKLSLPFFEQVTASPVPIDLRAIRVLKRSPLALDLYTWATRRVSYLRRPVLISWNALQRSFGVGYADTPKGRFRFRENARDALRRVATVYPQLYVDEQESGVLLRPSPTHVPKST